MKPSIPAAVFQFGSKETSSLSFASLAGQSFGFLKGSGSEKGFSGAGQKLFREPLSDDEEDYNPEKEADGSQFKPVVSLPAITDHKTGEEDEIVIYCHRAKLYRYDQDLRQWKERGIGDIKILLNAATNRSRVVMRRDQIHKLCANHYITCEMELKENAGSDRSWVWSVNADFADGIGKSELLAVRFKHCEDAVKFREKFIECQEKLRGSSERQICNLENLEFANDDNKYKGAQKESEDDIVMTYEKIPSAEQKELARRFALPETFYAVGENEKVNSDKDDLPPESAKVAEKR